MWHIPFTRDARLELASWFGSWPHSAQLILIGGFTLAALFLVVWLYRYELRLISRRIAHMLLALRLLVLVVVLLLLALRPAVIHTTTEILPSKVLIAIDRSESMNITDPQRDMLEKLQLAQGLKLTGDLCTDRELDGWIGTLQAGHTLPEGDRGTIAQVASRIDGLSRAQIAQRVLGTPGAGLLQGVAESHGIDLIGFDQETSELPTSPDALQKSLASPRKNGAAFTDLKLPLASALQQFSANTKPAAVVILTDGQHNWGEGPARKAQELKTAGIPVYPIVCGAKEAPPDAAIASVRAVPATVLRHADATIEARVLLNNLPPGKFRVTLRYPDLPGVPARASIVEHFDHDGITKVRAITLHPRMEQPGTETMIVTVEAEDADRQVVVDRFPENNSRPVTVNVASDKARVLLVDGEARWDWRYTNSALAHDPTLALQSVIFEQPRLGLVPEGELLNALYPARQLPADPEALNRFDCIILGDVSTDEVPLEVRTRLERYVSDRGGTLVLVAGKRSMPLEFLGPSDPFRKLLPVVDLRVVNSLTGFPFLLTPEGKETGFLRLGGDAETSREVWESFPAHYWAIVGKAKENAVSLAFCADPIAHTSQSAGDSERSASMMARQNYGFGRVIYLGIDSTWRWRYKRGSLYEHRFWSQLIRWAASDRALIAGNGYVRFGMREPVYRSDQEVDFVARLSDRIKKLPANALAGMRLFRKAEGDKEVPAGLVPLKAHASIPGELEGTQGKLPPGDYFAELVLPEFEDKLKGPDGKKLRADFRVLPPDSGEMVDLGTNWELLQDLAAKTSGEVYTPDRVSELIRKLQDRTITRDHVTKTPLVHSGILLAILLLLLCVEWTLRKWAGLP